MDIFHVAVTLHSFSLPCIILWILVQSDIVNYLIFFVGHCDIYFMVQCLVSLALFNR